MGLIPQGSALQGVATVPEIIWEAFLGLWLTFRGFSRTTVTSDEARPLGAGGAARAVSPSPAG